MQGVDYLNEKVSSKLKTRLANKVGEKFLENIIKNQKLLIKEIKGILERYFLLLF